MILHFNLGKLTIALFSYWLGFGYKDFDYMGKRKDFGFLKFWLYK